MEVEGRLVRPDQAVLGPDRAQIIKYGVVAGEDQMIAVVDHHLQDRIDIRPATPPRLRRRLDQLDLDALPPGERRRRRTRRRRARADDVSWDDAGAGAKRGPVHSPPGACAHPTRGEARVRRALTPAARG